MTNILRNLSRRTVATTLALAAGATVTAMTAMAPAAQAAPVNPTARAVVRPVAADGTITRGYHTQTVTYADGPLVCFGPAFDALEPGIRACGHRPDTTIACWQAATPTYLLCMSNPFSKALIRSHYRGSFGRTGVVSAPLPVGLRLRDNDTCVKPTGGTPGITIEHHLSWQLYYACHEAGAYGPQNDTGINRTHPAWTVDLFPRSDSLGRNRWVSTAYYVGNAH